MASTTSTARRPGGAGDKLLDEIFEKVAHVHIPAGASRLDMGLDIEARGSSPGVHLKLHLETDGARGDGTATAALVGATPPEVVFGPKGHGAIVFIAMADIEARRPDVKAKIDAILGDDPQGRTEYYTAANWPDRVRRARPDTGPWHYVDLPYEPSSPDAAPPLPEPPHALSQLAALSEALGQASYPEAKADALCFVLHIIGDIHQPFHCVTRITPDFPAPQGDKGGNLFALSGHYRNLHSLWDDSVNLLLPDSAELLANEVMQRHTRADLARDLAVKSPEAWARAGYAIAVKQGYGPLEADDGDAPRPSNAYLRRARDIGQRQAALGGYRLADWLIERLGG